jgi:hypothetical protein
MTQSSHLNNVIQRVQIMKLLVMCHDNKCCAIAQAVDAGLSPQVLRLNPRINLYGICDRVAWGRFLFEHFSFPLSGIPAIPRTCPSSGTGTVESFEAAVPRDSLSPHSLKLKKTFVLSLGF